MEIIYAILIVLAAYYLPIGLSYLEGNARGAREYKSSWKRFFDSMRPGRNG